MTKVTPSGSNGIYSHYVAIFSYICGLFLFAGSGWG